METSPRYLLPSESQGVHGMRRPRMKLPSPWVPAKVTPQLHPQGREEEDIFTTYLLTDFIYLKELRREHRAAITGCWARSMELHPGSLVGGRPCIRCCTRLPEQGTGS